MSDDMNDKHKEQLSAFIDNEIGPQALSEIEGGDPLLHRYQLIGEAVKGSLCDASLIDISAQVSLAIENEPAHSADLIKNERVKSSPQSSTAQSWFDLSGWLRPIGGMAVAASVAVVMVMVINQPETSEIGINGAGSQIAIDTRPVVSLPVNNIDHNISNKLNLDVVNNKDAQSEDDVKKIKEKAAIAPPYSDVNR